MNMNAKGLLPLPTVGDKHIGLLSLKGKQWPQLISLAIDIRF